ncbi:DUF7288 family protein [Natrarchaeobius chitinivorans]|uniref:Uncharacterized protein n=1 Tax=Natrarchaeobius chitinivorans TaxID=1679083 RepID=A0A3N6LYF1_NATCH|nr:hypothetical protein [Natrarchaeobius chitinivorans]RQG95838.1 hypothetical protein EA473_06520 [Natrarchaeobius chitinivorans]
MVTGDRGQIHTLEGILAAIFLVLSLLFALQASAVTPMTESTSSQHIQNQQQAVGDDLLKATAENGSLKSAVLYWDYTENAYPGTNADGVYNHNFPEELQLATELERALTDRGIAFNLNVNYIDDGEVYSFELIKQGKPSDHSVVSTQTLTLYENDEFTEYDGGEIRNSGTKLVEKEDEFDVPNESDGKLYNVVEIELIIWRM